MLAAGTATNQVPKYRITDTILYNPISVPVYQLKII